MSEAIIIAVITLLGTIIVATLSRRNRRVEEDDEERDKLVKTLQDLVSAQAGKITNLEELVAHSAEEVRLLRLQVVELREVIINQALLIQELSSK